MSLAPITGRPHTVSVDGDQITVHDLTVLHPEAAAYLGSQLAEHGAGAGEDLLRRAIPIGLVALRLGTASIDTGALARTLDDFGAKISAKSDEALVGLDQTLARLQAGEKAVANVANGVLANLPSQVEAALAGQAGTVKAQVAEAARAVQAAGMQELSAALSRHATSMRDALSLDREGPVRMLRQDLLEELQGTRRELAEQLSAVRALVEAAQAAKAAGATSSRAVGAQVEDDLMALCRDVVTAAGDMFERCGDQPGPATTRRTGDGLATLAPAVAGPGRQVRLVLESKTRARPLSAKAHRDQITQGCQVRQAEGGLVVVPTRDQVPGEQSFARVCPNGYVVAAEDPQLVSLIYLLLREQVALTTLRHDDGVEIDLAQVEAKIALALTTLDEFDQVGRLAGQAERALAKLRKVGAEAQAKARKALTEGRELLH